MKEGVEYPGVGCGVMILNSENKLFLAKRGPTARNEVGLWDFLGGAVDLKETSRDAAIREIKEEFNLDIEIISLLEVCENITDTTHWINFVYLAKHVSTDPKIMEEGKFSDFGWFSLEEIKKLSLTFGSQKNIELYENYVAKEKQID